jgi:hypothetical protein
MNCSGCGSKCCVSWGGVLFGLEKCPHLTLEGCAIYPKEGEEDMRPPECIEYPGDKECLNQTMNNPMIVDEDHEINIAFFVSKQG